MQHPDIRAGHGEAMASSGMPFALPVAGWSLGGLAENAMHGGSQVSPRAHGALPQDGPVGCFAVDPAQLPGCIGTIPFPVAPSAAAPTDRIGVGPRRAAQAALLAATLPAAAASKRRRALCKSRGGRLARNGWKVEVDLPVPTPAELSGDIDGAIGGVRAAASAASGQLAGLEGAAAKELVGLEDAAAKQLSQQLADVLPPDMAKQAQELVGSLPLDVTAALPKLQSVWPEAYEVFMKAVPPQLASAIKEVSDDPKVLEPVLPVAAAGGLMVALLALRRGPQPWLDELPLRYDAGRIEAYWRRRPLTLLSRFVDVGIKGGLFFLGLKLDELTGKTSEMLPERASQLRELITDLGPAFIKIAQVWASRPDVLPEAYNKEIQKLLERVRPFSKEEALQTLRRNLSDVESVFTSMDDFEEPIASASVGQVYRTFLKDGRKVAVKVQRPDVRESVTLDLYVIRQGAKLGMLVPFGNVARESRNFLDLFDLATPPFVLELDYEAEAANQKRFAETIDSCDLVNETVVVPEVCLATREVLVQEWLDGKKLTEPGAAQEQAGRVVKLLLNSYMVQFLETGYLHGDPHPGNFILMPSGKLGILDYGLMTEISPNRRIAFIEYLMHLQAKDYDSCLQDLVNLEFIPPGIANDKEAREVVVPALASTLATLYEDGGDLKKKREVFMQQREEMKASGKLDKLRSQLQDISKKYGSFRLPPYFTLIIRAFSTLEGLGLRNDGNFAIVKECFPYIARRMLTDDSYRMREALKSYLYKGRSRIAPERVDELAGGFSNFTNLMKGSRAEAAAVGGAPVQFEEPAATVGSMALVTTAAAPTSEPAAAPGSRSLAPAAVSGSGTGQEVAAGTDTATKDIAAVVFSPEGNFLQDLLIDEGVSAIDALSRAALLGLLRAAGPLALPLTLPLALLPGMIGTLFGSNRDRLLSRSDKESLLLIRRIVRLTQSASAETPALAQAIASRSPSQATIGSTARDLQQLQQLASGLLPTIAPGVTGFARRFAQQLARRALLRLAEDVERSAGLGGTGSDAGAPVSAPAAAAATA